MPPPPPLAPPNPPLAPQARGKSGPLFDFGVHEDIRVVNDASREKNESHAGKVVERHWYDRNKHIFPASRWEVRGCAHACTIVLTCAMWVARLGRENSPASALGSLLIALWDAHPPL